MKYVFCIIAFFLFKIVSAQSFSANPYTVTLPNVSTNQQNTLSTQQPGSLVYNSEQSSVNYFNGYNWKSLSSGQYPNTKYFTLPMHLTTNNEFEWIVPANVNKIFVELYSGGGCGFDSGGGCGGNYGIVTVPVVSGQLVRFKVGEGCSRLYNSNSGEASYVNVNDNYFTVLGGNSFNLTSYASPFTLNIPNAEGFAIAGSSGTSTKVTYAYDGTDGYKIFEYGNGGSAPFYNNGGKGSNAVNKINAGGSAYGATYGGFPGGGGGAVGGGGSVRGGDGLVILHW
ncbi:glycine-rich domain-containing protein [Emticicia soli]|uniref:Uncharacterized protein n=1 Tax=Emticicia soli TaxID=2027878 RepID=A0ABW5JAH6_9BACT